MSSTGYTVKFVIAGRPANRSFGAFVAWIGAFVGKLTRRTGSTDIEPAERSSWIKSWRGYWAAMDERAKGQSGR